MVARWIQQRKMEESIAGEVSNRERGVRFKCFSIRGDFIKAEIPASREGCGGRLRERERDCSSVRWPRPEEDCESSKSVEGNREGRRNTGEEKRKKMGDERKLKERERERGRKLYDGEEEKRRKN